MPAKNSAKRVICKRLKGLMVERGIGTYELAQKLGMGPSTLNLKINGKRDWWYSEVARITIVFGYDEIKDVFPELHNSILKKGA